MSDRRTHQRVGVAVGLMAGLLLSDDLPEESRLVYCLAALGGGAVGGALPDVLEPGLHSYHRDLCHSIAAGAGGIVGALGLAQSSGARLRSEAASLRARRLSLPEQSPGRFDLAVREYLIYLMLGFTLGLVVGYGSHLALDAATARGIPVVSRHVF